jgi:hypothetical protein
MKSIRVPAQITSIEDTIYGNITLKQFSVLLGILVLCFFFLIVIPPFYRPSAIKLVFFALIILTGLFLVYRPGRTTSQKISQLFLGMREAVFEQKTILEWVVVLLQYFLVRPRVYLHNITGRFETDVPKPPQVPQSRKTTALHPQAPVRETGVLDNRAFPVLLRVAGGNLRSELLIDDTYKVTVIGEGEKPKYVYVEKMAGNGAR